jgi:hypothetical protein
VDLPPNAGPLVEYVVLAYFLNILIFRNNLSCFWVFLIFKLFGVAAGYIASWIDILGLAVYLYS